MYAVITAGGKQYKVSNGDVVRIEKVNKTVGETVEFKEVLMVRGRHKFIMGSPSIEGSTVIGEVVACDRGKKIRIFKSRKRKNYRKSAGHRQDYTEVKIKEINFNEN